MHTPMKMNTSTVKALELNALAGETGQVARTGLSTYLLLDLDLLLLLSLLAVGVLSGIITR